VRTAAESKLLATDLLAKLLDSANAPAVRQRACDALQELTRAHNARLARLEAAGKPLIEKRNSAKREYEAAELAARDAVDSIEFERRLFAERRTALEEIACAGATGLERLGLTSVEDLERAYLGRRT
jgi:hypothetical protein